MIRCIAIDDEPLALKQLETYIGKTEYLELVAGCSSASEARKILDSESVDVIFTDINMPDVTGMEFIKSLAFPPMVVFTTAYSEYALDGFKVNAVDYLLKPFGLGDFQKAALKVKKQYDLEHSSNEVSVADKDNSIFFKTDYKIVRVKVDDIICVEGMSEYLKIHTDSGKEPVIVLLSMKKLEDSLPSDKFLRVHKSYMINLTKISQVSKGRILMEDETSVPVGDSYKDAFNQYINSKFLAK